MKTNSFLYSPAVFAVGEEYQILVRLERPATLWVRVGDSCFYDHSNGILRSDVAVHKVSVPMALLNREKKYTICCQTIIERKPYFTECEEPDEREFEFLPLPDKGKIRICHVADTHGNADIAAAAYERLPEKPDLLVLNGDIIDSSDEIGYFDTIYEICERLTGGRIPVVFSRGNHDLRGICAEKLEDYVPTCGGKTYYSFRMGRLWGLVLDCGEDKPDSHPEYGNTVCCHAFRQEETAFLERLANSCEYESEGIEHRIVIVHNPFTLKYRKPFNIEHDIFSSWLKILKEKIKPDTMLCGHLHKAFVSKVGSKADFLGQPCELIVGSEFADKRDDNPQYKIAYIVLDEGKTEVQFISN